MICRTARAQTAARGPAASRVRQRCHRAAGRGASTTSARTSRRSVRRSSGVKRMRSPRAAVILAAQPVPRQQMAHEADRAEQMGGEDDVVEAVAHQHPVDVQQAQGLGRTQHAGKPGQGSEGKVRPRRERGSANWRGGLRAARAAHRNRSASARSVSMASSSSCTRSATGSAPASCWMNCAVVEQGFACLRQPAERAAGKPGRGGARHVAEHLRACSSQSMSSSRSPSSAWPAKRITDDLDARPPAPGPAREQREGRRRACRSGFGTP